MIEPSLVLNLDELATRSGVKPRTIRFYIQNGVLRPPIGMGPKSHYTEVHLHLLQIIRALREQYRPLEEIRDRVGQLSDEELRQLASERPAELPDSSVDFARKMLGRRSAGSASDYARRVLRGEPPTMEESRFPQPSQQPAFEDPKLAAPSNASPTYRQDGQREETEWRRINLTPDLELQVRLPVRHETWRFVNEIRRCVTRLMEGDRP